MVNYSREIAERNQPDASRGSFYQGLTRSYSTFPALIRTRVREEYYGLQPSTSAEAARLLPRDSNNYEGAGHLECLSYRGKIHCSRETSNPG